MCDQTIAIHLADPRAIRPLTTILPRNCLRVPLQLSKEVVCGEEIERIARLSNSAERDLFIVIAIAFEENPTLEELEVHSVAVNRTVRNIEDMGYRVFGLMLSRRVAIKYIPRAEGDPAIDRICYEAGDLQIPKGQQGEIRAIKFAPYFRSEEMDTQGTLFLSSLLAKENIVGIGGKDIPRYYGSEVSAQDRERIESYFTN